MLTIILAETSLELVPEEIADFDVIRRDALRRHKKPTQLLLDRSYHHKAMLQISNSIRRGRPDIAHITLLTSLGSPLNLMGQLRIFIHTLKDVVISISPKARIPRNTERFKGLIEQLFEVRRVPLGGKPLLEMEEMSLNQLMQKIDPTYTVGLTIQGNTKRLPILASSLIKQKRVATIVGGFPRGHFSKNTRQLLDECVKIYPSSLEVWTVVSWLIFSYEQALQLS